MDNTGAFEVANKYADQAKVSIVSSKVGNLRKVSLLPLLQDILGGKLTEYVRPKDRTLWSNFLECCFPSMHFISNPCPASGYIYIGTADSAPSEDVILSNSAVYSKDDDNIVSDKVIGKYFWVAVPSNVTFIGANNLSFPGAWLPIEDLTVRSLNISSEAYTLYYCQASMPLNSVYQIIVK